MFDEDLRCKRRQRLHVLCRCVEFHCLPMGGAARKCWELGYILRGDGLTAFADACGGLDSA